MSPKSSKAAGAAPNKSRDSADATAAPKRLKIGIVGCGKIADGHVEVLQAMDGVEIAGVCDREPLMAEQIAVRYGIARQYDDFGKMLDETAPDVVHIATPPQSHLALAEQALRAGCHIFVEKPVALNAADTRTLVDMARQHARKLTVGYIYLFDPTAAAMHALIREGVIGEPVHVESFYGYNLAGQFGAAILSDPKHWVRSLPGKLLHNVIDHLLNKVVEFLPLEDISMHAVGFQRRPRQAGDFDEFPDELRVILRSGAMTAYGTFSSHIRPPGHFLRVYGTRNTLLADFSARTVTLDAYPQLPSAIGRLTPPFQQGWRFFRQGGKNIMQFLRSDFHFFAGMQRLFSEFYDSIRSDSAPPIPYERIVAVAQLMDGIFAQINCERLEVARR